jgi:nucleotide-binding universal stress UspA family protein
MSRSHPDPFHRPPTKPSWFLSSEQALEQATTLALACNASVLLVADPPPPLLEQEIRAQEEMRLADLLENRAEQLRSSTGLTVQTAFTEGDPEAFIERLRGQERRQLLIVTARQQAEHKVMRFLHQSNVPVLFVA